MFKKIFQFRIFMLYSKSTPAYFGLIKENLNGQSLSIIDSNWPDQPLFPVLHYHTGIIKLSYVPSITNPLPSYKMYFVVSPSPWQSRETTNRTYSMDEGNVECTMSHADMFAFQHYTFLEWCNELQWFYITLFTVYSTQM